MSTSLLQRLGLAHPIIQAPMAGSSTVAMAAAASNAGALGSLALGAASVAQARQALAQLNALTEKPFNVNFFCHQPAVLDAARDAAWIQHLQAHLDEFGGSISLPLKEIYPSFIVDTDMQQLMLEQPPAVVSFHFGLPDATLIQALKKAGVFLLATATNLEEARQIEAAGIDAIVAQGFEAGGHRGIFDEHRDEAIGTFALVRLLAQHSRLPIIAAGGIMDGQGIAAALQLGAQAVQLGTAFLLTRESAANAAYRNLLKSSRAQHTRVTAAISGRRARGIVNRFMEEIDISAAPAIPAYPAAYDAGKQLNALASAREVHEFGAHWAGQGAALIRDGYTVGELIHLLVKEWQAAR
ncbi:2-nitropropane dioxygenase [Herbaspirillum rubrisubalbicans]|uniref:Propionate 3-nitronate monooxygenase n=1 Tax=Herbaspirillum rubrisubalbicans TaxID=80842 RepID=A0ABX9C3I3_9BURK|nr:nitronate monooxygenase [Herbaspirillum rubrisubalbicans]RAM64699.1 2-nitropropane dioxygenase [Herbaspirillum rubrisubalbicans]RAN50130.1 2-nitropropane dioxygenase [Herbaspirillum rubrisubalbicans]